MKEPLKQATHQKEEQPRYSECGSDQMRTQGSKRRMLLTSFGRMERALKRLCC